MFFNKQPGRYIKLTVYTCIGMTPSYSLVLSTGQFYRRCLRDTKGSSQLCLALIEEFPHMLQTLSVATIQSFHRRSSL